MTKSESISQFDRDEGDSSMTILKSSTNLTCYLRYLLTWNLRDGLENSKKKKPEHFLANINVLLDNYCTDPSKYTFRLTKEG